MIRVWSNGSARPLLDNALRHLAPEDAQEFVLLPPSAPLTQADAAVVEIRGGLPEHFRDFDGPVLDLDTGDNERLVSAMESYPPQTRSTYGEDKLADDLRSLLSEYGRRLTIVELRRLEILVSELRAIVESNREVSEEDRQRTELRTQQMEIELRADQPSRRVLRAILAQLPGFVTGLLTNATFAFLAGLR